MTLKEYDQKIKPGNRVYVVVNSNGERLYGTAGNLIGAEGFERIVKFDNGAMAKVTEENCRVINLDDGQKNDVTQDTTNVLRKTLN